MSDSKYVPRDHKYVMWLPSDTFQVVDAVCSMPRNKKTAKDYERAFAPIKEQGAKNEQFHLLVHLMRNGLDSAMLADALGRSEEQLLKLLDMDENEQNYDFRFIPGIDLFSETEPKREPKKRNIHYQYDSYTWIPEAEYTRVDES